MLTCQRCNRAFPWLLGRGRPPEFCGEACREAQKEVYNERRRKPAVKRVCDLCSSEFTSARLSQRFCGDRCSRTFWRRESEARKTPEQRWNDRRRANYQKRRAQKKTGASGETIELADIRERDGSRCGICGKRVSEKAWPHPQSPSLDHIVPLSAGGLHELANVQLAHLSCNVSKGARGGGEQLRLVG